MTKKCQCCGKELVNSACLSQRQFEARKFCSRACSGKASTSTPVDRFLEKVKQTEGCWIWSGSKNKKNYGTFFLDGRAQKAHRVSYSLFVGPIADDLFILHRCDNPPCVNPAHLSTGTPQDNMDDMVSKGRSCIRRGEDNPFAKLSVAEVKTARHLYFAEARTCVEIGKFFSVSNTCIKDIVKDRTWRRHV